MREQQDARRDARRRTHATFGGLRDSRRPPLSRGSGSWLIWNQPKQAPLAPADEGGRLRQTSAQPRVYGARRVAARPGRAAGRPARRPQQTASHPSPRSAAWPQPTRSWMPTPTTVSVELIRDAVEQQLQAARGSRWRRSGSCSSSSSSATRVEADLADASTATTKNPPDAFLGVTLKRQATNLSLAAMRAWRLPAARDDADPVPLPRRATAEPLPDRARVRGRPLEDPRCRHSGCPSRRWGGAGSRRSSGVRSATGRTDGSGIRLEVLPQEHEEAVGAPG